MSSNCIYYLFLSYTFSLSSFSHAQTLRHTHLNSWILQIVYPFLDLIFRLWLHFISSHKKTIAIYLAIFSPSPDVYLRVYYINKIVRCRPDRLDFLSLCAQLSLSIPPTPLPLSLGILKRIQHNYTDRTWLKNAEI